REEFVKLGSPTEKDRELARKGLEHARNFLKGGVFMLVLDEAITAVNYQLLTLNEITSFLELVPEGMAVILTGRNVPNEILDAADLVTEMKKVKHPFDRGEDAVEGCEY
ncbi:MAG: cob(I)yrinic acid a,c-diamide adenosyltransferase, partial [Deltaproteobacteria bacterium]